MPRPKRPSSNEAIIDVLIEATAWQRALRTSAAIVRRAARAALEAAPVQKRAVEIAVVLTSDAAVRKLNAQYRGKDKPTNVLSFPAGDALPPGAPGPVTLGDVVVAYGTLAREAKEASKSLKNHLSHLVVHGVLHLLGYDHIQGKAAQKMEKLETQILARLGIPDPYNSPASVAAHTPRRRQRS